MNEMKNQSQSGTNFDIGYDMARQREMQMVMERRERETETSLKSKMNKIAELFEMDVLSEDDALKAVKMALRQHAKVVGVKEDGAKTTL